MNRTVQMGLALALIMTSTGDLGAQPAAPPVGQPAADKKPEAPKPRKKDGSKDDVVAMAGERTLVDNLDEQVPLEVGTQLRIFKQARKRKAEIERMEGMLNRRSRRLERLMLDMESRYKTLRMLQEELTTYINKRGRTRTADDTGDPKKKGSHEEKVARFAKIFDKMKADDAARMLPNMDEKLAADVIRRLRPKQAAKVLGKVDPELASRLSAAMTGTKKTMNQ